MADLFSNEKDIECVARALCAEAGEDPDRKTYAYEMNCTGKSSGHEFRWQYWISVRKGRTGGHCDVAFASIGD